MFCLKCGKAIPDNSDVCPECEENPREEVKQEQDTVVYATLESKNNFDKSSVKMKKILIGSGSIVAVFIVILITTIIPINSLKKQLMKDSWYSPSESILKVLEFDENKVEYRLETGYAFLNTSLFDKQYKVVSGSKFKIKISDNTWETYKVTFNDDKTFISVEPAITSTDSIEWWAVLD